MRSADLEKLASPPADAGDIGKLVDFADNVVPRDLVLRLLARYCGTVRALIEHDGTEAAESELKRHLVVMCTLGNRAMFEVFDMPQDRSFKL